VRGGQGKTSNSTYGQKGFPVVAGVRGLEFDVPGRIIGGLKATSGPTICAFSGKRDFAPQKNDARNRVPRKKNPREPNREKKQTKNTTERGRRALAFAVDKLPPFKREKE